MNHQLIKDLFPPLLLRRLTRLFYGWSGHYASWSEAVRHSDGYDRTNILEKVKMATTAVVKGEAVWERDSVLFHTKTYNFELLTAILYIRHKHQTPIDIIDFGGALGSLYHQHQSIIDENIVRTWNVIEQPGFVEAGCKEFQNQRLKFYSSPDECMLISSPQLMILSSVLQYLPEPKEFLNKVLELEIPYLYFDRTAFSNLTNDRLTVQKVHPSIYKATYPCWFLSYNSFIKFMASKYTTLFEFDAIDRSGLPSTFFKGMFLKLKS